MTMFNTLDLVTLSDDELVYVTGGEFGFGFPFMGGLGGLGFGGLGFGGFGFPFFGW